MPPIHYFPFSFAYRTYGPDGLLDSDLGAVRLVSYLVLLFGERQDEEQRTGDPFALQSSLASARLLEDVGFSCSGWLIQAVVVSSW